MLTIQLRKTEKGFYAPETKSDEYLMQHCVNEDLDALNDKGLEKARYIAAAHDWEIEII